MSDAVAQLVEVAAGKFAEANAIAEKVAKSHGSVAKDVRTAREESDHAAVVKYREWYEKAMAKINDETEKINALILSEGIVQGNTMTEDEVKAAKEEHKSLLKAAKELWGSAETVAQYTNAEMPAKPEVLTFSGKPSSQAGGASGGRRLRFAKVEVNGVEVKNLSAVTQKIKADTGKAISAADLQKALFESAGTEDIAKIGDHTFGWSETDDDGNNHKYDITVYARKDDDASA